MHFTEEELDELTISLREEKNRHAVPRSTIADINTFLEKKMPCCSDEDYTICSLAYKTMANYVADVPENARFVFGLIKENIPVIPNETQASCSKIDLSTLNFFIQVQLILLNNIFTTTKEMMTKDTCCLIVEKLFRLVSFCETHMIDIDGYLIIEILDECQPIIKEIEIRQFLLLRDFCLMLSAKARSEDDADLSQSAANVCIKYSLSLDCSTITNGEKEAIFFKLYGELSDKVDEQILLNIMYEFRICTDAFLDNLISLFFDPNTKRLKIEKFVPMSLLLLSNEIISEEKMDGLLSKISLDDLVSFYFNKVYPNLQPKHPFELQSIALFNKIPIKKLRIPHEPLVHFLNKLSTLINPTLLQVYKDVIVLQLSFLGKILASDEIKNEKVLILKFLEDLKLSNEFKDFPNDFKFILNQIDFPLLYRSKDRPLDSELTSFLKMTIGEANTLLSGSLKEKMSIPMSYMLELSKVFGFYALKFKNVTWFKECFSTFETVFQDVEAQMKSLQGNEKSSWSILDNNLHYTRAIINNS
ncbi:hypothetical protein PP714_11785 [Lacticaseibacillus paracasei]|nr:hypothetical protein [Lacticaseibacillus paracasei]